MLQNIVQKIKKTLERVFVWNVRNVSHFRELWYIL